MQKMDRAKPVTASTSLKAIQGLCSKVLRQALKCHMFSPLSAHCDHLPSVPEDFAADFSWGFIEAKELKSCLEPEHVTITEPFVDEAFEKGDRCFGVLHEGRLAHYSWYSTSRTRVMMNVHIDFPETWVYMYNAFTSPRYRGRKMYPTAVARALRSLLTGKFTTSVTLVGADNFSSLSPLGKIGFSEIGRMVVMARGSTRSYTSKQCLRQGVKLVCPS